MRSPRILIVDDEPRLVHFLRSELSAQHYRPLVAADGEQAVSVLREEAVDLVVLDLMMPGIDGFETCQRIRKLSRVPIIILSAETDQAAKVKALTLGADDYVTKPFDPEELVARITAVLRRFHPEDTDELTSDGGVVGLSLPEAVPSFVSGDLVVDYANRTVTLEGNEIKLSPTEYRLLCQLTRNAGRVLPHEYLLTSVWGPEYRNEVEYLWVYIGYLREKLERNPKRPQLILTAPGFGYRFKRVE